MAGRRGEEGGKSEKGSKGWLSLASPGDGKSQKEREKSEPQPLAGDLCTC